MPEITLFTVLRFIIRSTRIAIGLTFCWFVFIFGFGKTGELWSTFSIGGYVDGFLLGLLSLVGLVFGFYIAFGEGDPDEWHRHRFPEPEQENWEPSSPQSVKVGRAIGRFVSKVFKS